MEKNVKFFFLLMLPEKLHKIDFQVVFVEFLIAIQFQLKAFSSEEPKPEPERNYHR